jgi:phosphopantothenoylcysteine decarboxylase/phosphopantothenate--cysteine ligase
MVKKDERMTIELVKNPDILADLGARRGRGKRPVLVGFAMETHDMLAYARKKLVAKKCDLIVANEAAVSGRDDTQATLVAAWGDEPLPPMTKVELANRILDRVKTLSEPATRGSRSGRRPRRPTPQAAA